MATLEGHVLRIDKRDVTATSTPFRLTAGCHVVVTEVLNPIMGMSADTHVSRRYVFFFAFNAVAMHRYVIETTRKDTGTTVDRYSISIPVRTLVDYDESGAVVRRLNEQFDDKAPKGC